MSTSLPPSREPARETDHPLARAFRSFTEAAGSLERTYGQLHLQVAHLRQELEVTNRDLTVSLGENSRMRERLRHILESLPCGVLVVEGGARISALNPEAARLAGGSFETVEALPLPLRTALGSARETGEERELEVRVALEAAGEKTSEAGTSGVWVAIRHAWLERKGENANSVFILRDVSAAKQWERDAESIRRQRALVEMSALLAHEIRNPLGSLELFAGLLAESGLEGEGRRWIEHVQAGLRTLSSTVNNVLDLHNEPSGERARIDGGELLGWAYEFLMPLAHQARVEIQVINGVAGVPILADRHLLEQVLLNLALNAFHFMSNGGWLSIRGVDRGPAGVEIEVRDTGPGIPADDLPRIFEPGFTTRPGSSGLGLAVCRRILDQHGGRIEVESRPGQGTAFRLSFPAAREAADGLAAKGSAGDSGVAIRMGARA
ncbi:MAG: ATP-binding protein [Terriglobales bacterium]|jgi:signal transduction histidine kinase